MVTGDLNAALVEWVLQYRISDPVKFLFEMREPSETLRYVSESVMREVVGDRTVDEVITIGRQEIESEALIKMQALSTKYAMGISIDQVQLKNINPPEPKSTSRFFVFREVLKRAPERPPTKSGVGARPVTAVVPCLSTGDGVAKSRAGGRKPCRAASSSLLLHWLTKCS